MFDIIYSCNGQYIFSHTTLSHVVNLGEVWNKVEQIVATAEDIENLYVSDTSDTHTFVYKADGSFDYVRDFEFSSAESQYGSGHRELLAIKMCLILDSEKFKQCSATLFQFFCCVAVANQRFNKMFFKSGVDMSTLCWQILVQSFLHLRISRPLKDLNCAIFLKKFQLWATVDAFESSQNKICEKFFSL